jgi:uncharacterized protein YicC (UPF0701 family)
MAENESLDLKQPGGLRWQQVLDAVKKKLTAEEVAHKVTRKLPQAIRKAMKEFVDAGVTFEDLLKNRNDLKALSRLVRKCQGHEYAHLFAQTAAAESDVDDKQLITSFADGIVEQVSGQITHEVAGSEAWPTIAGIREFMAKVQSHIAADVRRIAKKLAADPTWLPTVSNRRKSDADSPTKELLSMSLIGVGNKK